MRAFKEGPTCITILPGYPPKKKGHQLFKIFPFFFFFCIRNQHELQSLNRIDVKCEKDSECNKNYVLFT